MKTITTYELLGLVKDGKELPKKVKVLDVIYEFDDHYGDYYNEPLDRYLFVYMTSEEEWKLAFFLNVQVEILEENELHANSVEFNINNDKRDCVITLDENDLGIDKLHLDNCYFYKENDKWYVKKYDFKSFKLEEQKKIPEKLYLSDYKDTTGKFDYDVLLTINEIIDYLDYLKSKGDE